jgi:phage-related protein
MQVKKPLKWVGSSKRNLDEMPSQIRNSFGYRLWQVQIGKTPHDMKPLFGLGHGIYELREQHETNAYRLMYVAHLRNAVYVLDVYMKKSKTGIGISKPDVERIQARFKAALLKDEGKNDG